MIGRRIGSWILERELGRGGMGSVFEARHASLPTRAAVKVLSPGLESEESFRQRFHREADLQAQLRHANIARVLDYLEDNGEWFLVIEYLDRGSLADVLARGERISQAQALAWTRQALAGLAHAHQKGIVHRDIKPANLLLGENGEIVVADFGIARADGRPALTTTGVAVGTPQYMSPEQILTPDRVDQRSDIYSLGIVLYELLAGRKPFDSGSQFAVLQAQVNEPPPPLGAIASGISTALESVVMRSLAKKAEDRYPDCQSMIRDLDLAAQARPSAPPSVPMGATVHASVLFERATIESPAAASPGDLRNRKRLAYQRRLAAGVAVALVIATLFAFRLSKDKASPSVDLAKPPALTTATQTTTTQTTTTREMHKDTAGRPGGAIKHVALISPITTPTVSMKQPDRGAPPGSPPVPQLPAVPRLPERPRIAVIGTGDDPLLAGALEQEMERRLEGFDVADEQGSPEVSELLQSKGAKVAFKDLGATLLKNGFQILILLRVEKADSRTTSVHGIEGSVKAARMRLNGYLLPNSRPLGSGWTEPAEYTELSASSTAKRAFIGPTADLRNAIDSEWAQLRGGAHGAGGGGR